MKYTFVLIPILFLSFLPQIIAQKQSVSKEFLQKAYKLKTIEDAINPSDFFEHHAAEMGLSEKDKMEPIQQLSDQLGFVHNKYQQFHNGIEVVGARYSLHIKDDLVKSASGHFYPNISINTKADIHPDDALDIAMESMKAEKYSWEKHDVLHPEHSHDKPKPTLVIVGKNYPRPSEYYHLAYQIDLYSQEPFDAQQYYVDAHNGAVILQLPLLQHSTVPAQGVTKYYGTQTIYVDSIGPNEYLLQDLERGDGVITYDNSTNVFENDSKFWDLTNADQDEVAIDAHFAATEYYDYLLEKFNWTGLGNNGEALKTRIHAGDFVNAFWNGSFATFGDGNCNNGPLTTLEVVSHEFTHGLTDYTSDLVYSDDSGGINESLSDVFGKALEHHVTPNDFNWNIGSSFLLTDYVEPFRSMEDPNLYNNPKYYKGQYWTDGGSVHSNSGVGNHWFYLIVEGKNDVNEMDEPYNVIGMGMDKAMEIVFRTQSVYLGPNSTYPDYYEFSSQAAEDIYGVGSPEFLAVQEAWKAVGLPSADTGDLLDLSVSLGDFSVFTCGQDEYYTIEVTVANVGAVTHTPSMGGTFDIENDYEEDLIETIEPGETKIYTVEDYWLLDYEGANTINIDLNIPDDSNSSNNDDFQRVENSFFQTGDMSIEFFNIRNKNCVDKPLEISITVSNRSCDTLYEGTEYILKAVSGNSSFTFEDTLVLSSNLNPDRNRSTLRLLDVPYDEAIDLEFTVEIADDPNLLNNSILVEEDPLLFVRDEFFSDMDDAAYDLLRVDGYRYEVLDWNTDAHFMSTGFSSVPIRDLCPTPVGIIEANFASTSMEFCIEYPDNDAPELSFNLAQFRATESIQDYPDLFPLSTIARMTWETETEEGEEFYYDQAEGVVVSHGKEFPEGFKGKIIFDFNSHTGDQDSDDYLDFDVNLFDDLRISSVFSNTKDPASLKNIEIFPNPSNGLYFAKQEDTPKAITISNAQGIIVREVVVLGNKQTIDLSNLANGIYLIVFEYEEGLKATRRIVKL